MALALKHQTAQEFIARFREAYRDANRQRLARLARFILARLQAGDITDAQCRNAFNVSAAQWTALKTRMQNLVAAQATIDSSVGE